MMPFIDPQHGEPRITSDAHQAPSVSLFYFLGLGANFDQSAQRQFIRSRESGQNALGLLGPREKLRAINGRFNKPFFLGPESGFKTGFSRVQFRAFSSPKRSPKTRPKTA
jgi:hypothetical protein